jgi:hypothetical protein
VPLSAAGGVRRGRRFAGRALHGAALLAWLWSAGALAFAPYATAPVRTVAALGFLVAGPLLHAWLRRRGWPPTGATSALLAGAALPWLAWSFALQPSNARSWAPDQARLPQARIAGSQVTIENVRNFTWHGLDAFEPRWERREYDLDGVASLWFAVEPFSGFPGAAHTFVSFGFDDGRYLAVSVEIRKEAGESFSPWKGLYRNYELMYVLGDERDLVQLRTGPRRDTVYLYPLRASRAQLRAVFLDVLDRANALAAQPEFYHSAGNNCTTNLARHANRIVPGQVPFSWHLLLPGHADARALALGMIDFDGALDAARARFRINERAARAAGSADFSDRIREP